MELKNFHPLISSRTTPLGFNLNMNSSQRFSWHLGVLHKNILLIPSGFLAYSYVTCKYECISSCPNCNLHLFFWPVSASIPSRIFPLGWVGTFGLAFSHITGNIIFNFLNQGDWKTKLPCFLIGWHLNINTYSMVKRCFIRDVLCDISYCTIKQKDEMNKPDKF